MGYADWRGDNRSLLVDEAMKAVTLFRPISNLGAPLEDGTFGKVSINNGEWSCYSGELPDRNNSPNTSRIPSGEYTCHWIDSPAHGECYQVMAVPNRTMIEIHSANWFGDAANGKFCQLLGCIALGKSIGILAVHPGQMALLQSSATVHEFNRRMEGKDFKLTIAEEQG